MKVLFWGADEHCGTTCNMSAIASYAALANHTRSFLMQHKAIKNDLDLLFQPITKQNTLRDISAYYVLEGMDYLIYQERANRLNWESLRECLYSAVDGQIFYLPAGARQKPGLYPGKTGEVQKKVIRKMEELADVVFVDLGHNMDAFPENFCMKQMWSLSIFRRMPVRSINFLNVSPNLAVRFFIYGAIMMKIRSTISTISYGSIGFRRIRF